MTVKTINNIKLSLGSSENELVKIAEKELGAYPRYFRILKKSLDSRNKNAIKWVYSIECSDEEVLQKEESVEKLPQSKIPTLPVVVVGSGPSGLFCALRLLEYGIKPLVLERGKCVEEREKDCNSFFASGTLNTNCNVQFGEGGAGTFSDGKLNTGTHSEYIEKVLHSFVLHGAPREIEWLNKPHIGSDNLKNVVASMRKSIIAQGGSVRFNCLLQDIKVVDGKIKSIIVRGGDGKVEEIAICALITAIGHSARDTFEMMLNRGVYMRSKDFAVGVRIEHLQKDIGFSQYGKAHKLLPPADYKLVSHTGKDDRSAFTFCMCPGGVVMPSASEEGGVVVNGMSNYARDGVNANCALIAQVKREDYGGAHPLSGVNFQREIEQRAYEVGGGKFVAPLQKVGDFLLDKESKTLGEIQPTYARGTAFADLRAVLPRFITDTLKSAITDMDKRLRGFARYDALLTAPETRTSSPVRIERDKKMRSLTVKNLYPCGEGAGYAGGITSSAVDGIKVADAFCKNL